MPFLTRNPKLKWPICRNLSGINELKKSHQTALGIASIFSIHFCSNILRHLDRFNFGFRVNLRRRPAVRLFAFAIVLTELLSPRLARADYVGNPLNSGPADGDPPLAILGEFGGSKTAQPGPASTLSFPTNGTVNDIQIYNANPGGSFAIFTVRPEGADSSGRQRFAFINGQTFTSGAT